MRLKSELQRAAKRANVDYEAVEYGMRVEGAWLLECFIAIVISSALHLQFRSILFIGMFSYLRIYCGGYHCRTYCSCGLLYVSMVILGAIVAQYMNLYFQCILGLLSLLYLYAVSPVQNDNNILENNDIVFYRKIATRRLLVMTIIQVIAYLLSVEIILSVNCMVLFSLAILCLIQRKENKKNEYL